MVLLAVVAVPVVLRFSDLGAVGALLAQVTPLVVLGLAMHLRHRRALSLRPHRAPARKRWVSVARCRHRRLGRRSLALSVYFSGFANFNKTYGSLGAIIGLMFWMYANAFIVLLGAELNASLELQTARDTTPGRRSRWA